MMDFRRALLAVSLGLILLLLWQAWQDYNSGNQRPAPGITPITENNELPTTPVVREEQPANAVSPESPVAAVPTAPSSTASPVTNTLNSQRRIMVRTDLLEVDIDTFGGGLREARLLKYPVTVETPDIPFRLLKDISPELLVAQSGLVGNGDKFPNHKTVYRADASTYILADDRLSMQVPLKWTSPLGVEYTKTYTFYRDSYLVDVEYQVNNKSGQIWRGYQYGQFLSTENQTESEGFLFLQALPSYQGAAIYTSQDKYDKIDFKEIRNDSPVVETEVGWVAMLQHYFVTAWIPTENAPYRFYTRSLPGSSPTQYQVGYLTLKPKEIVAGSSGILRSQIYIGPKEQNRIEEPAEGLILTVDYGWLTPVSSPLFWILEKIHDFVGNWGWSIILLTLLVKIVFYPLSAASYKSMAKMKKLQPRLKTLKERYGEDKQKMNQEMMQIYKKEKINPLGGCLPILIQIPVFIALYWVLLESVELRQAPFILWLTDLSRADPFYVLPVLMGASMFAQQFLNPTPLDAMQRNIMMSLPVVFTIFFLWFPSGLVLYWLVNNVLSIAQQWYITRKLAVAK